MEYKSGSEQISGQGPLRLLTSKELFAITSPPIIACGQAGAGKTVLGVDMVLSGKDTLTGLVYCTNSYEDPRNVYLRSQIPAMHVKNWDLRLVCEIWADILKRSSEIQKVLK